MKRSIGLGLVMSLVALVFAAVPAFASASITAENEEGGHLDGAEVSALSTDLVTEGEKEERLECEKVEFSGTFQANVTEQATIGATIEEAIAEGGGGGSLCATNQEGISAEVSNISVEEFFFHEDGTDTAHATFVVTLLFAGAFPVGVCHYEGPINTDYEKNVPLTGATADVVTPSPLVQTLSAEECPLAPNAMIRGHFDVTSGNQGVVITEP